MNIFQVFRLIEEHLGRPGGDRRLADRVARGVVPDAPEPEADARLGPAARLAVGLQRVSERALVLRGERLVLLIDGLDQYEPRPGSLPGDLLGAFLQRR